MNTTFKYISNIRRLLYDKFYSDNNNITNIINSILENFELFSINYNSINHSIELKIKKTNMRKNSAFSHTATYYYTIFNPIFLNIFSTNSRLLKSIIDSSKDEYNLCGDELDFILNPNNIPLLFNITTMSDNIIIIYL